MPTHDIIYNRNEKLVDHIKRTLSSTERSSEKIKTAHPVERDKGAKKRKVEVLSLLCDLCVLCALA